MFFTIIGYCMLAYFLFYLVCFCIFDCDVLLGLADKFGKSVGKLLQTILLHDSLQNIESRVNFFVKFCL